MNVLSLFDGMSCGRIALERAGITPDWYFASEICRHAISVTTRNWSDVVQLGCVNGIKGEHLPKIDLLIGGSPCQGFSSAGLGLNFNDPRSALFFEYVRLLRECQPKYFLLENVVMKQEWQDVISNHVGCEPVLINSALVSAQNRPRLYWTNIPFTMPADKGITFAEVLDEPGYAASMVGRRVTNGVRKDYDRTVKFRQFIEQRHTGKSSCLTTVDKDNVVIYEPLSERKLVSEVKYRYLTRRECERLQTVPEGYTDGVSVNQAKRMLGNGWTVDVIANFFKHFECSALAVR